MSAAFGLTVDYFVQSFKPTFQHIFDCVVFYGCNDSFNIAAIIVFEWV